MRAHTTFLYGLFFIFSIAFFLSSYSVLNNDGIALTMGAKLSSRVRRSVGLEGIDNGEIQFLCDLFSSTNMRYINPIYNCMNSPMACSVFAPDNNNNNNSNHSYPNYAITLLEITCTESGNIDSVKLVAGQDYNPSPLEGLIPTSIGLLQQVKSIIIDGRRHSSYNPNSLSGSLPTEIALLSSLGELQILNTRMYGRLPQELTYLSSLEILRLRNNYFDSAIPDLLNSNPSLLTLDLSQNQFTSASTLLTLKTSLLQIVRLDLSDNHLSGALNLDSFRGAVTQLFTPGGYLGLGGNKFSFSGCWPFQQKFISLGVFPDDYIYSSRDRRLPFAAGCNVTGISFHCECNAQSLCHPDTCVKGTCEDCTQHKKAWCFKTRFCLSVEAAKAICPGQYTNNVTTCRTCGQFSTCDTCANSRSSKNETCVWCVHSGAASCVTSNNIEQCEAIYKRPSFCPRMGYELEKKKYYNKEVRARSKIVD